MFSNKAINTQKQYRSLEERFPCGCPRCDEVSLLSFENELFCRRCDWSTIEISLEISDFSQMIDEACALMDNPAIPKQVAA